MKLKFMIPFTILILCLMGLMLTSWINIFDELPKDDQQVVFFCPIAKEGSYLIPSKMYVGRFIEDGDLSFFMTFDGYCHTHVSHWLPFHYGELPIYDSDFWHNGLLFPMDIP